MNISGRYGNKQPVGCGNNANRRWIPCFAEMLANRYCGICSGNTYTTAQKMVVKQRRLKLGQRGAVRSAPWQERVYYTIMTAILDNERGFIMLAIWMILWCLRKPVGICVGVFSSLMNTWISVVLKYIRIKPIQAGYNTDLTGQVCILIERVSPDSVKEQ